MNWRWNMDYGGGQLMDWVGHHLDIAHWALGLDLTGPVEVSGTGEFRPRASTTARHGLVETRDADGTPMVLAGGYAEIPSGTKWIGDDGWVWGRSQRVRNPAGRPRQRGHRARTRPSWSTAAHHYQNFLDAVRTRGQTLAPAEVGHRSAERRASWRDSR